MMTSSAAECKGVSGGVDAVSLARVKKAASRRRFLERVFTEGELRYCFDKRLPYRHLAGRLAAKEACYKALGAGPGSGVSWKDIEVVNGPGAPELKFSFEALRFLGNRKAHLSIAYSRTFALAFVAIG